MHKEVAIEPAYLSSWERIRFVMGQCGFDHGRLISEFPKQTWKKQVMQAVSRCADVEKKKVEEYLNQAKERVIRTGRHFEEGETWTRNAKREHNHRPFHAIVTNGQPDLGEGFIDGDDIHAEHPTWKVNTDCRITRTTAEMGACAVVLLRQASSVQFIDPYFDLKPTYVRPLCKFIELAWDGRPISQMSYHFKETREASWNPALFETKLLEDFHPRVKQHRGLKLSFFKWRARSDQVSEGLHARYILTDVGGLSFEHGLDEGSDMTDVKILAKSGGVYPSQWLRFSAPPAPTELAGAWGLSSEGVKKLH
ncbi:MAG: hypothetical protein HY299_00885 [Verrucomicrobia bacterium]|nr:hypothetical protein [Verrucomicrobiota bacterium]